MNMKRLMGTGAALLLMAVALAGCTTFGDIGSALNTHVTNPLNDQQVLQLGNGLGVAQSAVVGYSTLPLCPKGTNVLADGTACHQKALLADMSKDMHTAITAYGDLVNYQQTHPQGSTIVGGTFGTLLSQAQAAVAELQSLIKVYNVGA